jgi:hypothetical protein
MPKSYLSSSIHCTKLFERLTRRNCNQTKLRALVSSHQMHGQATPTFTIYYLITVHAASGVQKSSRQ